MQDIPKYSISSEKDANICDLQNSIIAITFVFLAPPQPLYFNLVWYRFSNDIQLASRVYRHGTFTLGIVETSSEHYYSFAIYANFSEIIIISTDVRFRSPVSTGADLAPFANLDSCYLLLVLIYLKVRVR